MRYDAEAKSFEEYYSDEFALTNPLTQKLNRIRKMKGERDLDYAGVIPRISMEETEYPFGDIRVNLAPETLLNKEDYPEFSDLIDSFVASRGIESVNNLLRSQLANSIDNTKGQLVENQSVLQIATGQVFELFAHKWIMQQEEDDHFLDPASCGRLFRRLWNREGTFFTPDGVHISFSGRNPEMDWLFEYKTNPEAISTRTSLNKIRSFIKKNSGQTFDFPFFSLSSSVYDMSLDSLVISETPRMSLVIPANRNYVTPKDVDVIKTPFDSYFISRITHSVLNDISHA